MRNPQQGHLSLSPVPQILDNKHLSAQHKKTGLIVRDRFGWKQSSIASFVPKPRCVKHKTHGSWSPRLATDPLAVCICHLIAKPPNPSLGPLNAVTASDLSSHNSTKPQNFNFNPFPIFKIDRYLVSYATNRPVNTHQCNRLQSDLTTFS